MHPTEKIKITMERRGKYPKVFILPASFAKEMEELIASRVKQAKEDDDSLSIPAEEVFLELADPALRPAALLRGSRYKEELTQKELAAKLGIRQHHLSEMENAKRPIGKEMAKKLAKVLNTDYRHFL